MHGGRRGRLLPLQLVGRGKVSISLVPRELEVPLFFSGDIKADVGDAQRSARSIMPYSDAEQFYMVLSVADVAGIAAAELLVVLCALGGVQTTLWQPGEYPGNLVSQAGQSR